MRWTPLPLVLLLATLSPQAQELEQDPIVIRAGQGLPKTLYIAPWQRVGEPLQADPVQGGWQDDPQPVERESFLRELELQRQGYSVDRLSQPAASSSADSPREDTH